MQIKTSPKSKKEARILSSMKEWKEGFVEVDQEKHWEEGRSAESLAWFFMEGNGEQYLIDVFSQIFNTSEVVLTEGTIEDACPFDQYSRPRMQDMTIRGTLGNQPIFVAIEAKVDEPFGDKISTVRNTAVKYCESHPNSKRVNRIDGLEKRFGLSDESLRYQLLLYLGGSVLADKEGNMRKEKYVLMPVLVFETDLYNRKKAAMNEEAYHAFMKELHFEKKADIVPLESIAVQSNNHTPISVYQKEIEGIQVISFYSHITRPTAGK